MKNIVNMIHAKVMWITANLILVSDMRNTAGMTIANVTTDTVGITITGNAATGIGTGHAISSRTTRYSMTAT